MKKSVFFLVALLTLCLCVSLHTKSFAQVTFAPYVNYSISGTDADHLTAGDFNNDGLTDIVVATGFNFNSSNDYKLRVYLQDVSGHLSSPIIYPYHPVYPGLYSIASGDINNDGLKDVVIGFSDSIGIFYQNTFGTFDPQISFYCSNGNGTDAIKIYDIDGDGNNDIATVSWFGQVVVFYSNAIGNLTRVAYPSVSGSGYDDLEVAKIKNDSLVSIIEMGDNLWLRLKC